MITIEKISIMTISFKIFNSRRKYIRIYRYICMYGSLPLLTKTENIKERNFSGLKKIKVSYFIRLGVHHSVPS